MTDQYAMSDPMTRYPRPPFETTEIEGPGSVAELNPRPDHGEATYRGSGRLEGRKALVTGADSGIGRAAAIAYAREGADVALNYLPEEQADAGEVAELIRAAGRNAVLLPGDIAEETFCEQLVADAVAGLGGLDIVANVAGKQQNQPSILDITTEQFDETFKTNVYALFWICKAAVPHLPPGSAIINTASQVAYSPPPILLDYSSTKAAINNFSKCLAQQLVEKGIRVNVVAPGPFWTPLQPGGGQPPEKVRTFGAESPMGRPGQPAEVAGAYVYLASGESSYTTGATININGGTATP